MMPTHTENRVALSRRAVRGAARAWLCLSLAQSLLGWKGGQESPPSLKAPCQTGSVPGKAGVWAGIS